MTKPIKNSQGWVVVGVDEEGEFICTPAYGDVGWDTNDGAMVCRTKKEAVGLKKRIINLAGRGYKYTVRRREVRLL